MMPERYIGPVMELCLERRGVNTTLHYLAAGRVEITSEMPLAEVIFDFYDRLKIGDPGLRLLRLRDARLPGHRPGEGGHPGQRASRWTRSPSWSTGTRPEPGRCTTASASPTTIPEHQFKIAIQGAIGGQIIARTTINAFRKDVTAKCYGGDITRKRKLLEKQKKGKKRMKMVGNVEIPQSAFVAVLKTDRD